MADGLIIGSDGLPRCGWPGAHIDYLDYHDTEWGVATHDDVRLFEKLSLEAFQSGLSWLTILRKRDNFRAAFAGFDPATVASFGDRDVARLLADAGIVRHRGKIEAVIANARACLDLVDDVGSLDAFVWQYAPQARTAPARIRDLPATSPESTALAKDLKRRGWRFVGPTTAYAFMQSMGLVNDHLAGCAFRDRGSLNRGRRAAVAAVQ